MSMQELATYKPMQDITNGKWYAARRVPGCHTWHGEVECLTESAAKTACDELNRASERAQRELIKLQQQLGKR